ncbi:hypothetical protein, variant [Phytophthora nicotianae P1569]|uniref:Uncharacterized protein n=1 Tax=Phytophthora nicotianae P1569 TaxID=1317065 RepID=V9E1R8_PHYNI|nr:hypothetical protein F443_20388 [Phytophthora nicotianae P1569]ETI32876.1 hypothetical protein, variant [Phytophthora nicotianae P1569]
MKLCIPSEHVDIAGITGKVLRAVDGLSIREDRHLYLVPMQVMFLAVVERTLLHATSGHVRLLKGNIGRIAGIGVVCEGLATQDELLHREPLQCRCYQRLVQEGRQHRCKLRHHLLERRRLHPKHRRHHVPLAAVLQHSKQHEKHILAAEGRSATTSRVPVHCHVVANHPPQPLKLQRTEVGHLANALFPRVQIRVVDRRRRVRLIVGVSAGQEDDSGSIS